MSKSVWSGYISFGLVAIPISLFPVEKKTELHFHLLDSRDKSRIRYERVNSETGKKVPWNDIVKAYEFDTDTYAMAVDLIKNMYAPWAPEKYHDEYRDMLMKWIENKIPIQSETAIERKSIGKRDEAIDFMTLLKQSMRKKSLNKSAYIGKSS
jgi:non-homologous end joining protein Ku